MCAVVDVTAYRLVCAGRGLGVGIVRGLAKQGPKGHVVFSGARVCITFALIVHDSVRDDKKGQAAIENFKKEGITNGAPRFCADSHTHLNCAVSFVVFDVTDSKAVSAAVESILKTHKRIDVLVNNSGEPDFPFSETHACFRIRRCFAGRRSQAV